MKRLKTEHADVQNRSGAAYFMGQNWSLGGHISMTGPYK